MKITDTQLKQIYTHAAETWPRECCGFLLGHPAPNSLVCRVQRAVNQSRHPDRFTIGAGEFARAWLSAEQAGLEVIGIYHSHPNYPAIPSQTDLDNAWVDAFFLISALHQGQPLHTGVWQLASDAGPRRMIPVPLEIVAPEVLPDD